MEEAVSGWLPGSEKLYVGWENVCWDVQQAVSVSSEIFIRRKMDNAGRKRS